MTLARPASLFRLTIVLAAVAGLCLGLVGPAFAAPPSVRSFPAEIDPYQRYEKPTTCQATEQPGVKDFRALVMAAYPSTGRGNIVRMCGSSQATSDHHEGRAWDWMVDVRNSREKAAADELIAWLLATDEHGNRHALARRFGISYIIWNKRVWKAYDRPGQWHTYTGSNPHTDHVHFSFSWAGAKRQTTFGTAPTDGRPSPDVPLNRYFTEPVRWMADLGITTGRGDGKDGNSPAPSVLSFWRPDWSEHDRQDHPTERDCREHQALIRRHTHQIPPGHDVLVTLRHRARCLRGAPNDSADQ